MKKLAIIIFVLGIGISTFASGKQWLTNLEKAMKLSEKSGKPILIEFSGSDWCPPCMRLNKSVFSQKSFLDFAEKNLILVSMDFPRNSSQTSEQKRYNNNIARKYRVKYFPTVFLLDSKGKMIIKIERRGPVKEYIEFLKTKIPAKKNQK